MLNDTTDANFEKYVQRQYANRMDLSKPDPEFSAVIKQYPSDPTQGSPYNTSVANQVTPQFKREFLRFAGGEKTNATRSGFASFQGDLVFHGARRLLFSTVSYPSFNSSEQNELHKPWFLSLKLNSKTDSILYLGCQHTKCLVIHLQKK